MEKGRVEEVYFPDNLPNPTHGPLCMLWVCPMYDEDSGMASVGMTVPQRVLDEADMRLPSSTKLQKSYAAGAIMIGDAANSAECTFDYGIPSAMFGGMIAAGVLKDCLDKGDVSEEALSAYQKLAEENLNDGLILF